MKLLLRIGIIHKWFLLILVRACCFFYIILSKIICHMFFVFFRFFFFFDWAGLRLWLDSSVKSLTWLKNWLDCQVPYQILDHVAAWFKWWQCQSAHCSEILVSMSRKCSFLPIGPDYFGVLPPPHTVHVSKLILAFSSKH